MAFAFRFKEGDFQMFNVLLKLGDSLAGLYRQAAQGIALMAQCVALMAQCVALNCG